MWIACFAGKYVLLPLLGFVKHIVPALSEAAKAHAGIRGAHVEKFPFLWGAWFSLVDFWVGVFGRMRG